MLIFSFGQETLTDKHYIAYAYDFGAVHLADPTNNWCFVDGLSFKKYYTDYLHEEAF
jgi:hypothetical protein